MRLMVCGTRTFADGPTICSELEGYADEMEELLVGDARGPDLIALSWAKGRKIPATVFRAKWDQHGRAAGPIRNAEMVKADPDQCLAFWDGKSRGTMDAIRQAVAAGVRVRIVPAIWNELLEPAAEEPAS